MKSKVVLLSCPTYEQEQVYQKLKTGMEILGGISRYFRKDEKILLKPNLLKKSETEKAVITHPAVVGAFARLLRESGCENLTAGDSSGTGNTEKIMAASKMDEQLKPYGVRIANFQEGVRVSYPQGKQAREFMMAKEVTEADALVSLSKMKTHALERITGAVKNSYGFIYGFYKAQGHTRYPSADSFARMLVDLNQMVEPRLYIMDGITAMEGNGPGSGDPVAMGVFLLSEDPVALDSVFCRLIHLDPRLVPTNYHGEKMKLGTWKEEEIQLLSEEGEISMETAVKTYGNPGFRVDRTPVRSNLWDKMAKVLNRFQKKPYIVTEKCIRCGICVESCPVPEKAVAFQNGRKKPPVYNYKKCIRCFCCQEMCPAEAIQVTGQKSS